MIYDLMLCGWLTNMFGIWIRNYFQGIWRASFGPKRQQMIFLVFNDELFTLVC